MYVLTVYQLYNNLCRVGYRTDITAVFHGLNIANTN